MTLRRTLPLAALVAALLATALAAPAQGRSSIRVGLADQSPRIFSDPLFQETKVKRVRYLVPWDWRKHDWLQEEVTSYLTAAAVARKEIFVTFTAPRGCWTGRYSKRRSCRAPSPRAFKRAFLDFRRAFPQIRVYAPWNEVNHASQPTYRKPKRAAQYYNVLRRACRGCKVLAADVLDSSNVKRYLKRFMRHAKGRPRIWGLHNYSDVNRKRSRVTRRVLKLVRGELWLTETGGIVRFDPNFPYSTSRAASRTSYMFKLSKRYGKRRRGMRSKITRIYPYSFYGEPRGARFDAGLVDLETGPRKAYGVFVSKLKGFRR